MKRKLRVYWQALRRRSGQNGFSDPDTLNISQLPRQVKSARITGVNSYVRYCSCLTYVFPAPGLLPQLLDDESFFEGKSGQARHRAYAKFAHQALAVGLHRPVTDAQLCRDLLVGEPLGDADQHISLTAGE